MYSIIAERKSRILRYTVRVGTWVNLVCFLFFLQQIYEEAKKGFEDALNTKEKGVVLTKDDKAHGSLLIMNELIRSASFEGEVYMYYCCFDQ